MRGNGSAGKLSASERRAAIERTAAAFGIARQSEANRPVRREVATSGDVREQPRVADGASELLQDVFGKDKNPCRLVNGVASLPLGTPVELALIFEVAG
jgi:hypothetical protein